MEYRTKNCGELNKNNIGEEVKLAGWVQKIRNLGKMVFIDLRDEFGITQIIVSDETSISLENVTQECTITVTGRVEEIEKVNDKLNVKIYYHLK